MNKISLYDTCPEPKTLILGIDAPYQRAHSQEAYFQEFLHLVSTNGSPQNEIHFLKVRTIDPVYFLTRGKLDIVREICEQHKIAHLVLSEQITSQQERNLADYLGCSVTDRAKLILEIFEKAAYSAEGKTQVAIAMLQHRKSRLAGKGIHLSQQSGVKGVRGGSGETLKERERRQIDCEIKKLERRLDQLKTTRNVQRKQRLKNQLPLISLVGYTNAGKSTILNTLTKSDVLAEDKLFATLDTTSRSLFIGSEQKGIISDTVGFIQQLPPQLLSAFMSTLSELEYADLLLHVVDCADPNWQEHIHTVQTIFAQLAIDKPTLYVFNKSDCLTGSQLKTLKQHLAAYAPRVIISSRSRDTMKPLIKFLSSRQR